MGRVHELMLGVSVLGLDLACSIVEPRRSNPMLAVYRYYLSFYR